MNRDDGVQVEAVATATGRFIPPQVVGQIPILAGDGTGLIGAEGGQFAAPPLLALRGSAAETMAETGTDRHDAGMNALRDKNTDPLANQFFAGRMQGVSLGTEGRHLNPVTALQAMPASRRGVDPQGVVVNDLAQQFLWRRTGLGMHIPF